MHKRHEDYQIGIICPLPVEHVAMQVFLDEKHDMLPVAERDQANYTLGSMSGHDVVLATLPMGMFGAVSAAVTARDMIWSFSGIKFCLLVGIGAGLPSGSHDIRLGDVVVSSPVGVHGGVVQIDMGKQLSDGTFQRMGSLNRPPSALLQAVMRLRSEHELRDSDFSQDISRILETHPRMRKRYECPGQDHDLLFQAHYQHAQLGQSCSYCDMSRLVQRPERHEHGPEVHYGLIATSNHVLKDAIARDHLIRELNALCLEMEASGLMNTLPCLVIKGIADYADSHKDSDWQGYAALAASAYTKQLLSVVPATMNRVTAAAASLDLDLSRLHHFESDIDDRASLSSDTLVGTSQTGDLDIRVSAAKMVAQALRSLFHRCRSRIATNVTEMICDQESLLEADQVKFTSVSDGRLMRLLKDRFSATSVANTVSDIAQLEEIPTMDLEEVDVETEEPSDTTLTDLTEVEQILCHGSGFEDMLGKLEELLLPPVHVLLEGVLGKQLAGKQGDSTITCVVEWELLQLVGTEDLSADDIDRLFTLSGDFKHAHADLLASCAIWDTSKDLLEAVKTCIATAWDRGFDPLFPANKEVEKEYAVVDITGSATYINMIVKQLAWLTATLRVPHEGMLTVSYINFQPHRRETGEMIEGVFRMSLWDREQSPRPSDGPGQCWTQLFAQSVLAYGFTSSAKDRPESMRGLELPFEIMATFAGIRFPLWLGDRRAFASETHVLVPEELSGASIQWHYDTIENALQHVTRSFKLQTPDPGTINISDPCNYRAFLGYSKFSEVVMGTAEFRDARVNTCKVPRTGNHLTLKEEGPLSAGMSAKGHFNLTMGTSWKFKKGEQAQIEGSTLSLDELLKRAAKAPALLYDDESCTAFLFSELSIVIQMTATHLQDNSKLAAPRIPRAIRSSDGGNAAYEAIKAAKDLEVHFGMGGPKKYPDIVKEFLEQLEQRKKQKQANQSFCEISLKKGLRGWSYADIQEKRFEFWERELPTDLFHSRPIWWQLFGESNVTILFGRGMPQPIRILRDHTRSSCTSWDTIPAGQHLLLANVRDLERLKSEVCDPAKRNLTRFMLTTDLAWARPADSRLFDADCRLGGHCSPLQTMRNPKTLWWQEKTAHWLKPADFLPHPGPLEPEGCVLFADDPSAIEKRPCRLARPDHHTPKLKLHLVAGAILIPLLAFVICNFIATHHSILLYPSTM
ncbi:unnamed protein product [Aureobasidium uvarum]|uniref:Nucleoside phosphorylase domain-containing protein n=1 Tax=Aureobasidium uvarum TaxID=2773716 RepID=A0A9N8PMF2_9PEZI|nr:unnamed protein product [Aureobasidium uvarum]